MPSWNIHTAQVESLLADRRAEDLGIQDENAFLFGNYVPDVYVGYMVPDVSLHIDYCITHCASMKLIPVPDADWFWDHYIARRGASSPAGRSLALGAWAHLVTDRFYNGWFRTFSEEHDVPEGEELRLGKQGDFDTYGSTLGISTYVSETPALLEAAWSFRPYRILPDDVRRAVDAANAIVRNNGADATGAEEYRLLDPAWMASVFKACDEWLAVWLSEWHALEAEGQPCLSAVMRAKLGLPSAESEDSDWMVTGKRPSA